MEELVMSKVKFFSVILLFGLMSSFSYAVDFQPVFTDNSGVQWSAPLKNSYTNGCEWRGSQVFCYDTIEASNSAAAMACSKIGGKLPTIQNFVNLVKTLNHTMVNGTPMLTEKGLQEFSEKLSSSSFYHYWTSNIDENDKESAMDFYPGHSRFYSSLRGGFNSVHCVK
jgi:hypothetical protein